MPPVTTQDMNPRSPKPNRSHVSPPMGTDFTRDEERRLNCFLTATNKRYPEQIYHDDSDLFEDPGVYGVDPWFAKKAALDIRCLGWFHHTRLRVEWVPSRGIPLYAIKNESWLRQFFFLRCKFESRLWKEVLSRASTWIFLILIMAV